MHSSVQQWTKHFVDTYSLNTEHKNVLEIGSYDVNGSVKPLFNKTKYTGIDLREGPNVDYVLSSHNLRSKFVENEFDIVLCLEVFEHDPAFWISMEQINKVLKPNGFLILTARGNGFQLHEEPYDFWRFMPNSFPHLFRMFGFTPIVVIEDPQQYHPGVLGFAQKGAE